MVCQSMIRLFFESTRRFVRLCIASFLGLSVTACVNMQGAQTSQFEMSSRQVNAASPKAPREFRAAWVATVANIDWPSRAGLSSEQQQAEIIAILDIAQQMKLNAIILQVRPSADAIYPSELEPWTEYLSGVQDKAPDPWYDPLAFWVKQAHQRGLELHAWFNPYRAKAAVAQSAMASRHVSFKLPKAVKQYGELLWMDPSSSEALERTLAVILDVVKRYDIDGVHIDDYFYPYPIKGEDGTEIDFPDAENWQQYRVAGGQASKAEWRREQVNRLVKMIHERVHQEKSWVKFGISPFGIGKPANLPKGISGFSQYDKLYADVELWLAQAWLDYLAPQLYWPIQQTSQAFPVLMEYWQRQNSAQRHIWPGLYTSRVDGTAKSWESAEILNQIQLTRTQASSGHIHFSMAALLKNRREIKDRLEQESYVDFALVPESTWLPAAPLAAPRLSWANEGTAIEVSIDDPSAGITLAVWQQVGEVWRFSVHSSAKKIITLAQDNPNQKVQAVLVAQIDRSGREGPRSLIQR